jgi:site-specific DNA recombinase
MSPDEAICATLKNHHFLENCHMQVVGYARVSTEEQAVNGQGLDVQRAKLEAYCSLYELTLLKIVIDSGVSGKTLRRDGLHECLQMLSNGTADGLVVCKLDRLTRSVGDWQMLIEDHFSEKAGKQLFSVADSIDTRTAAGRLVLNVLLSVAQWEREIISERTRETLQHKISKHQRCGKVRYGFDLQPDGLHLAPNAAEQAAIQLMRDLRGQGLGYRRIAAELTSRNIATKEGRPWAHTSVKGVLQRNPAAA